MERRVHQLNGESGSVHQSAITLEKCIRSAYGSPAALVQLIVTVPPDVGLVGASIVRAETKGATSAKRLQEIRVRCVDISHEATHLSLENILKT